MKKILAIISLFIPILFPAPTYAHAFGQLYTLPLPVWLYLYGGGAAVIVSFLAIGWFINRSKQNLSYPTFSLSKYRLFTYITSKKFQTTLASISLFIFSITIIAGFVGNQFSSENLAPVMFWIILLLGMTYLSAIVGNIWNAVNPFKIIARLIVRFIGSDRKTILAYPKRLGYVPSLSFYFVLIWLELLSGGVGTQPQNLSIILLLYTAITVLGTLLFGEKDWFAYGEFFTIFFGLISKIAPVEGRDGKIYLRPPYVGLLKEKTTHASLLLFILFMLSSTAFDGFRGTSTWVNLNLNILYSIESALGNNAYIIIQTIFLLLSPLFFLALYLLALILMKLLTKCKLSIKELSLKFAFSLIPIALAYNVAHYYTLLLTQGQSLISLVSDPFNLSWNLLGTANYITNITVVDANFTWHSQVAVIIIGHIAAVYLAHLVALSVFPTHKKALVSQLPMLILMVCYTMTGLWILSQPITGG